jgi:hypothetical protein
MRVGWNLRRKFHCDLCEWSHGVEGPAEDPEPFRGRTRVLYWQKTPPVLPGKKLLEELAEGEQALLEHLRDAHDRVLVTRQEVKSRDMVPRYVYLGCAGDDQEIAETTDRRVWRRLGAE